MITENQHTKMLDAAKVEHVTSYVIVLFATHKRAFILNIEDISKLENNGTKSLNIKKISKWPIPYIEIRTLSSRKALLDYDPEHASEIFKEGT